MTLTVGGNPILLKEFNAKGATEFQMRVVGLLEQISGQLSSLEGTLKRPCM